MARKTRLLVAKLLVEFKDSVSVFRIKEIFAKLSRENEAIRFLPTGGLAPDESPDPPPRPNVIVPCGEEKLWAKRFRAMSEVEFVKLF